MYLQSWSRSPLFSVLILANRSYRLKRLPLAKGLSVFSSMSPSPKLTPAYLGLVNNSTTRTLPALALILCLLGVHLAPNYWVPGSRHQYNTGLLTTALQACFLGLSLRYPLRHHKHHSLVLEALGDPKEQQQFCLSTWQFPSISLLP